jgi:hypothetical protein
MNDDDLPSSKMVDGNAGGDSNIFGLAGECLDQVCGFW